jgi:geranylgeranyl reductase family protein
MAAPDTTTDVLVVGGGPGGAAAAAWCASAGLDTLLVDSATFPRDKPCGDGLTPRAIAELRRLGLSGFLLGRGTNFGLRAHGFGQTLHLPWPGGGLPSTGSAAPRVELDNAVLDSARTRGAKVLDGAKAVAAERGRGGRVGAVTVVTADGARSIACERLVIADGARSKLGRQLGRTWHQDTAYGVAVRGYIRSGRSRDPWISSHLELRDANRNILSGYGWVFPLGSDSVNIGVGTLATSARPAEVNLRSLLQHYVAARRGDFDLTGEVAGVWSALLPMGGAVSGVAGPNWVLVGDAAGCVNPLNGEGIDYALETGRLAADLFADGREDCTQVWPAILSDHYGEAFSIARRLAGLLTVPGLLPTLGPWGMRSRTRMTIALRLMGNLVTPEDHDGVARIWRAAGRASQSLDERPPFR